MTEDPEVYYYCGDCAMSFVEEASNGVYIKAPTDHAMCFTCGAKDVFACWVYPDEQESEQGDDQKGSPEVLENLKESCPNCRYMTLTDATLYKARKAIMRICPSGTSAQAIIKELIDAGLLIRERI